MKRIIVIIGVVFMMILAGCGKEDDSGLRRFERPDVREHILEEHILEENIMEETILYENVTEYWD